MNQDQATIVSGEFPVASTREQLEALGAPRTEFETAMFNAEKQRLADAVQNFKLPTRTESTATPPSVLDLLGKHAWSLKCLTESVRSLSKTLDGERRANATLALRHLEDALHRMDRAKALETNC